MAAEPQPVHSVEPELDTPDADLLAWEAELDGYGTASGRDASP